MYILNLHYCVLLDKQQSAGENTKTTTCNKIIKKINYNYVPMLHNVPTSVQKDYIVAALLLLRPAMKTNIGRSELHTREC